MRRICIRALVRIKVAQVWFVHVGSAISSSLRREEISLDTNGFEKESYNR